MRTESYVSPMCQHIAHSYHCQDKQCSCYCHSISIPVLERYEALLTSDKYFDTRDHLPYLRSVAKGSVLEIGTDVGNSTTALLLGVKENGGHLTSVDIKDCSHLFDDPQWTFVHMSSKEFFNTVAATVRVNFFDVVYIDGSHELEDVRLDIANAITLTKKGGLILMHDVECPAFPGVRQAFDEIPCPKEIRTGSWGLGICRIPE